MVLQSKRVGLFAFKVGAELERLGAEHRRFARAERGEPLPEHGDVFEAIAQVVLQHNAERVARATVYVRPLELITVRWLERGREDDFGVIRIVRLFEERRFRQLIFLSLRQRRRVRRRPTERVAVADALRLQLVVGQVLSESRRQLAAAVDFGDRVERGRLGHANPGRV